MLKKMLPPAVLLLLVSAYIGSGAAEQLTGCRLKGGSMVQLTAETCALEGGTPIVTAVPVAAPVTRVIAPAPVASAKFSDEPKLAAAQKSVIELLNKPVVESNPEKGNPEGIERMAKFDECRLGVEESMHVDYGNLLSSRMNLQISSSVDFRTVSDKAFGILGKVSSIGGGLKAHAVYFEEPRGKEGNSIAVSMLEQKKDGLRKFTMPGTAPFWDAPRDDLWMLDEYGYPKENSLGNVATDRIRILFFVSTSDDAAALKKALNDVHALCKP